MTPKQRRAFLESIPWITRLKNSTTCDGLRWGRMPLKAIYNHGPNRILPPTGTDPYKCKNPAYWKFKALKRSHARDGIYCVAHLYSQLHNMDEDKRIRRWIVNTYGSWEAWEEQLRGIV
jgi:hypothetical protein